MIEAFIFTPENSAIIAFSQNTALLSVPYDSTNCSPRI